MQKIIIITTVGPGKERKKERKKEEETYSRNMFIVECIKLSFIMTLSRQRFIFYTFNLNRSSGVIMAFLTATLE